MPCYDGREKEDRRATQRKLDEVTAMLCACCAELETRRATLPPAIAAWWVEHKAADQQSQASINQYSFR